MHLKQKHPHLQVILSIGGSGASEVFPIVASSTILRDNFARSARGLVEASGLDGIDSTSPLFLLPPPFFLPSHDCLDPPAHPTAQAARHLSHKSSPPSLTEILARLFPRSD